MASKRRPVSLSRWLGLGPEGKKRPRGSVVAMSEEDTDSDNVPLSRSMEIIKVVRKPASLPRFPLTLEGKGEARLTIQGLE
eukprot:1327077-Amorphochlora_amoeboformis.AAC.1